MDEGIPLRYNQFEQYFDKKNRVIYRLHYLLDFFLHKKEGVGH
jgi:hypothetical protein